MLEAIYNFLLIYCNCTNIACIIFCIMAILFVVWCIFGTEKTSSLKKINKTLREQSGEDIIISIESLKLSKRFRNMWDDYYTAYTKEDTVALNNYLLSDDMRIQNKAFRYASAFIGVLGFAIAAYLMFTIQSLPLIERTNLLVLFFVVAAFIVFFDFLYYTIGLCTHKKTLRLLEEFKILSQRKLSGKAFDFSQKHLLGKIRKLEKQLNDIRVESEQLNARFDKLFDALCEAVDEEEAESAPQEQQLNLSNEEIK